MIKHFNIKITGEVQGVGFRYYAREKAIELELKGHIVNQPSGAVYIEIEGEQNALEKFISWCRQGPDGARVANVKAAKGAIRKFADFRIDY